MVTLSFGSWAPELKSSLGIEDAHVVGARVVVKHGQRLPHPQAHTRRCEQFVGWLTTVVSSGGGGRTG